MAAPKKRTKTLTGGTNRKLHSNNKNSAESDPEPSRMVVEPPTTRLKVTQSILTGKPKPVVKKSKKRRSRSNDETVDNEDPDGPTSVLIQIPDNLIAKSVMGKAPQECSRQEKPHKAELLTDYNQNYIDHIQKRGWDSIAKEFNVGLREPALNPATRFVITTNVPPDTDEYDANQVDFPGVDLKFIVAQAPTADPTNRETFWRMVYDSNVTNIFFMENQKDCADNQYEPFIPMEANANKDYGKMNIGNKKVTETKRDWQAVLEVLPEGCSNSIIVRFAQCINFPDKCLQESEPRKAIVHLVRLLKEEKGKVIVCCRSGLARSCMFVMIHVSITLLNSKALKEIAEVLAKLRADRWGAIQTVQQYLLVHQALLDYIQIKTVSVKRCEELKKDLFRYLKMEVAGEK